MKRKGFTLIELLAVIAVLTIIALIVTPIISNIVEEAKVSAFKNSVYGIVKVVRTKHAEEEALNGYASTTTYDVTSGTLKYKGVKFDAGNITINEDGKVKIENLTDGDWIATKGFQDKDIQIVEKS